MALGYVVALVCEAAGLIGLVVGIARLRAESRARAAELRGLLLTGNSNAAAAMRHGVSGPALRRVVIDPGPLGPAQDSFAARAALDRALETLRQVERNAA